MIDLDELESAARKPWYCRSKQEDNLLSPEVLVDLITRLRKAEKDAARYRWMRDDADGNQLRCCMGLDVEYWDKAVDRAMQCNK